MIYLFIKLIKVVMRDNKIICFVEDSQFLIYPLYALLIIYVSCIVKKFFKLKC